MSSIHPARCGPEDLETQCRVRFTRGSGPGGQHRNKVETHVTIEHVPSGIIASAGERRSQAENRKIAMHRLRCALAVGVRTGSSTHSEMTSNDRLTSDAVPSELWVRYCRGARLRIAETNVDFPAILAEALDVLAVHQWDPARAGKALGISATQMVGLAAQYPPALELLNLQLVAQGRSPRVPPRR